MIVVVTKRWNDVSKKIGSICSPSATPQYLVLVPSNGKPLGRMGLTRETLCCAGVVCRLDVNTCHRGI